MRDIVTTALDIIGLALLTKAGFTIAAAAGFAVAGGSLLFVSWQYAK